MFFKEKQFSLKSVRVHILFKNYNNKMSPKEFFTQLSLLNVNLYLKSDIFCPNFFLYFHLWIRIQKAPENGSNTDPDPQHC